MSNNVKLMSELRFKGFEEDWKSVKLEEVFETTTDRCGDSKNYELLTLSSKNGVLFQKDTSRKDISSKDKKKYWVVRPNQMICNSMVMWKGTLGVSKFTGLTSPDYYVLKISNENENNMVFFENYFKLQWVINIFDVEAQGLGTKRRLKFPRLSQIVLPVPSIEEQNRITNFLSNIDKKIKLMEQIQDLNLKYKKGLLQQMFVSNSVGGGVLNSPTLRFKGFIEDWKSVKLKDVFTIITEKNNGTSDNILSVSANYGMIAQSEIFSKRIAGNNITKYSLVKKGDFVYNRSRSSKNPWGVIKCLKDYDMGVVSSVYFVLRPNNEFDELYLENYFLTKTFERELGKVVSKSVRALLNVTKTGFLSLNIKQPSKAEQEKISSFFSSIDINLKSNLVKLENLKLWKKSLLQKMFV